LTSRSSIALSNLRGVVIVIVVAFHSMLAYLGSLREPAAAFDKAPYRWISFPIVDSRAWFGFDLFCALQNVYLMSFMFLLSGLFVWPSLVRKGEWKFLRGRLLRLDAPAALAVLVLMPIALFPVYRVTATNPSLIGYWESWRALPFWPVGPIWFVWLLLPMDLATAVLRRLAPGWGERLGQWSAWAGANPTTYYGLLVGISAAAYVPLALVFGPWDWWQLGPFAVESSRALLYPVYFFAGAGLGAYGLDRGLFASEGPLARGWGVWLIIAVATFALWIAATAMTVKGEQPPATALQVVAALAFVGSCAAGCLAFAAVFLRWGGGRSAVLDSLSENAYGIYLLHYPFVVWMQFALLGAALVAVAKAALVVAVSLLSSWTISAALRGAIRGAKEVNEAAPHHFLGASAPPQLDAK